MRDHANADAADREPVGYARATDVHLFLAISEGVIMRLLRFWPFGQDADKMVSKKDAAKRPRLPKIKRATRAGRRQSTRNGKVKRKS